MRWIAALVLIPLLVACGSNGGPATGTERGDCYPNSTCNAGLSCVYGVCLYVPDGFQAGEVAPDVAMADEAVAGDEASAGDEAVAGDETVGSDPEEAGPGEEVVTDPGPDVCAPSCPYYAKPCSDDGCGGICVGSCSGAPFAGVSGQCVCQNNCGDRECGVDECGFTCGHCASSTAACTDSGKCCEPLCAGKVCGDDACGGSCGSCGDTQVCTTAGACCTPACTDANPCGEDGCGGWCSPTACGAQGTGHYCDDNHQCASCDCGGDYKDGWCGSAGSTDCAFGYFCTDAHLCQSGCPSTCGPCGTLDFSFTPPAASCSGSPCLNVLSDATVVLVTPTSIGFLLPQKGEYDVGLTLPAGVTLPIQAGDSVRVYLMSGMAPDESMSSTQAMGVWAMDGTLLVFARNDDEVTWSNVSWGAPCAGQAPCPSFAFGSGCPEVVKIPEVVEYAPVIVHPLVAGGVDSISAVQGALVEGADGYTLGVAEGWFATHHRGIEPPGELSAFLVKTVKTAQP